MSNDQDAGQAWTAGLHDRLRAAIRQARDAAGISAQDVADETSRLGYPISRSALARYEGGQKLGLDVSELLVIAAALRIPPITLLFGGGPDGLSDVLPGDERSTVAAIAWFAGDPTLSKDAVVEPNSVPSKILQLTRDRAELEQTLDFYRSPVSLSGERGNSRRKHNARAAETVVDQIREIDTEIDELTGGVER